MLSASLRNGLLILAGLLLPAVSMAAVDITAPTLVSVAFAPGAVDVSATTQSIGVTVEAADNGPGVQDVYCNFRSPSGQQNVGVYMGPEQLVQGTQLDGVYSAAQVLGECAESGTWTLSSIVVRDQCGNITQYAPDAGENTLAYPGAAPFKLLVTNTNAAQPLPGVTGFAYTPDSIDLGTTNVVTVTITGTNIGSGSFTFVSPSGNNTAGATFSSADENPPGTFTKSFDLGICTETGTWALQSISVSSGDDSTNMVCGGVVTYDSSNLPPNVPEKTLVIANPDYSQSTPRLVALTLDTTNVNISNGPATLLAYIRAEDGSSGVAYGDGIYEDTTGDTLHIGFTNPEPGVVFGGNFTGSIDVGSCTHPGVYSLKTFTLTNVCGGMAVYGTPKTPFPKGVLPSRITVLNGAGTIGTLQVNLLPSAAVDAGATWYLDGQSSDLFTSGQAVMGLAPGEHTVGFAAPSNNQFMPPAALPVTVVAGQTTATVGTYTPNFATDAVQVNLVPDSIGAQWSVDSGPLQASGAIVAGLADGTHTIAFSSVAGFTAPQSQVITTGTDLTTITTGTYSQLPGVGLLIVNIAPPGAITEGCTWSVDGGAQQVSGRIVPGLNAAPHTVSFAAPNGSDYAPPASQTIYVIASGTAKTTGSFAAISGVGSLSVSIYPSALKNSTAWYVTSGANQKSGASVTGLAEGPYTVSFTPLAGYIAPASQNIVIEPDQAIAVTGTYVKAPPYVGTAESFAGLSAAYDASLSLSMQADGQFTGKVLTMAPATYVLSGSLDQTGAFTGHSAGGHPISYTLQVTGSNAGTYLASLVSGTMSITGYPAAYAPHAPVRTGKYTMLLQGVNDAVSYPQGIGYANVVFSAGAVAKVSGRLGDGTPFSTSSLTVNDSGTDKLFFFDPSIYGGKGGLSGVVAFSNANQFAGNVVWRRPQGPGSYYPEGFDELASVAGDFFTPNKPSAVISSLTFAGPILASPVTQPFESSKTGVVTASPLEFPKVSITVNTYTGVISGYFLPAVTGVTRPIPFMALYLDDPNNPRAGGYYVSPVLSGTGTTGGVTLP